jgi:hypothetical protein
MNRNAPELTEGYEYICLYGYLPNVRHNAHKNIRFLEPPLVEHTASFIDVVLRCVTFMKQNTMLLCFRLGDHRKEYHSSHDIFIVYSYKYVAN